MTRGRWREISLIVLLMVISLGLGWNALSSKAGAAESAEGAQFAVSSLDLSIGTRDAVVSAESMVPGDEVITAVTVVNSGPRSMTYAMRLRVISSGGAALAAALVLTIRSIGSSCADFDGITLFEGPLDSAVLGVDGAERALPAATAEILCFRAALPFDADNSLQGTATTVLFSFGANGPAATR